MSYQAYFREVEAVSQILSEWVQEQDEDEHCALISAGDEGFALTVEQFTAIWQAVELLSRAQQVLLPLITLDVGKAFLNLPEALEKPVLQPERPKKAHLYDVNGKPL